MSYERLIQEHDEIDRRIAELMLLINGSGGGSGEISAKLSVLGIAVDQHFSFERWRIYAAAATVRSTDPAVGDRQMAALETIRFEWRQYLADWIGQIIETDWKMFQRETAIAIDRLTAHMRMEAQDVYPFALQHGLVQLHERDAKPGGGGLCEPRRAYR